jgi:hypothetical protein
LRLKLFIALRDFDKIYPPIGNLTRTPTGDEAEMYTIAMFIHNSLPIDKEFVINPYNLKLFCREKLRYAKYNNISFLIDAVLKN